MPLNSRNSDFFNINFQLVTIYSYSNIKIPIIAIFSLVKLILYNYTDNE